MRRSRRHRHIALVTYIRTDSVRVSAEAQAKARDYIAENGYDNVFGARPLKRFIQKHVETPVARYIIQNDPEAGAEITVDAGDDGLFLK